MSFFSAILSKFLDQYIEKVDKNQVKVSLIKGHAELQNISFTPNLLSSFGVPLTIKKSCVGQIIIDVHSESALLKAINVDLYATPEWDALNKVSINSVANLIQSMEDEKKATKADKQKAWGNWFEKAIDNATVDVQNVRLHIEYQNWDGTTSSLTLFFESLRMNTVDSKGQIIILKQKPDVLTKRVILSSFSIASYHNVEPFQSFDQLNDINYNFLNQNSFTLTIVHDRRKDSSFLNAITINFDPILFTLTQEQFFSFQYLFKDISKSQIRRKFESCMRPLSQKMNEKYYFKMWSYLFRCAIKIKRPVEFRPNLALQFLKKRKEYAQSFIKSINKKQFVKKSIKKNGEDLTYLLIQYSAILMRRKERMIDLDQKEIDAITSEDLTFFSKDSFSFKISIQGICLKIPSYLLLSINNINGIVEKKRENINLQFEVQNWLVDDLNSNCEIIQVREEKENFLMFKIESFDNPAFLDVSRFKIDLRSSFIKNICKFFVNKKIGKSLLPLDTSEDTDTLINTLTEDASLMDTSLIKNEPSSIDNGSTTDNDSSPTETDTENDEDEITTTQKIKSSSINQFLSLLNPRSLMKFKINIRGFTVTYSVDNNQNENARHSFTTEIDQIVLKNFSKTSTETVLNVKSKMLFGPIKVDDAVISEGLSLKSSTLGIIDKYYFLGDLVTKLDVLNANIEVNSRIIDKVCSILSSLMENTQSGFTKIYSDHKIYANCSDISVNIDTGINKLVLSIAGMNMNPTIELREITILDNNDPQINIPSLCFNKWPIIETDLLNLNLNSYEFFNLLDEVNAITNQITKLTNVFMPTTSQEKLNIKQSNDDIQNDQIKVIAHRINYKMGDRSNSVNFNNVVVDLTEDTIINIDSLGFYDLDDKEFLLCDNKISLIMKTTENKNIIKLKIPCLRMNFLWNQISELIDYFHDSRDLIKENFSQSVNKKIEKTKEESKSDSQNFEMIISIENEDALINIENTFSLQLNKFNLEFLASNESKLSLNLQRIDIDNLLEVNDLSFNIESGFIFNILTSSVNVNLSQAKATKIFNLEFIPGVIELAKKYRTNINKDFNVNINNFTFTESSTDLHLIIPIVKFTLNSAHSLGAMSIPKIQIESFAIDDIRLLLLFNSSEFNIEDLDSAFSFDRKKVIEDDNFKLTNVILNINSINFDYVHYFVMRVFNSWKIYSKFIIKSEAPKESSDPKSSDHEITISGLINQINVKEHNLTDTISLLGLSFEQKKDSMEFKCKSINCIELVKVREENHDSNFFTIQTTQSKTSMIVNPIDVYLNINTMKTLTNINESLASLIKTDFNEKINQTVDKDKKVTKDVKEVPETTEGGVINIDAKGIQIHLPFEDDPLFKKHDLIVSFNAHIDILMNLYKSFSLNDLKIFFTNYQKDVKFLPIFNDALLYIRIDDNNTNEDCDFSKLEIDTGDMDVNLSVLDIFELQMIINNFRKSFTSLLNPQTCSVPDSDPNKKKLILTALNSQLSIKPINISLCEENRASLIYNPIFSLNIEAKSSTLNLQNRNQSFSIDLIFSISHMNLFEGKFEPFMFPTDFFFSCSNGDSNTAYFGLSIKTDIDFNITPDSFRSIMRFIDKFHNKEKILLLKNESKFNYKPEYWVRNNLNSGILIKYHKQEEYRKAVSELFVAPNDFLPLCEFHKDSLITFQYKNIQESFSPKNLLIPIYFKTISVSMNSHENYSQSIVFNSPLSIQNKLDCNILIYIKANQELKKFAEISPKGKFPLHFEEQQYYAFSTFESIIDIKSKRKFAKTPIDSAKPKVDINHLPEPFTMSLNKTPKVISIQNLETRKSIDFLIKVNNDVRSNTRVYEIIPSIFVKNILPCPIFTQLYNRDNSKINNEVLILQSQDERQINLIDYDTQSILISLSFDISQFPKQTALKLDNYEELFACNNSIAIRIRKRFKSDQKEIVIFTPCAIFNNTEETILFSPSNSKAVNNKIMPSTFAFYGLESYSENEKSMKIDISTNNSETKIKAIDCMRLNSNCTTIYLPRKDNNNLFYPINCSITLGQYPMNITHVITFTPYLYVINNLPFDFSLIPITSSKVDSIETNYRNLSDIRNSIESDSQFLLKDSFSIQKSKNPKEAKPVPIKWVSKDSMFLFSTSKFANNPIIQLNKITRTIFLMKNKTQIFYIELDIYEDKSTLYAHFQLPSYPVPLVINNSLDTPIYVFQNIKPLKNKLVIGPNTSSIFAFDEPFINNKQLFFEIAKNNTNNDKQKGNKPNYAPYLFSMQEQLSPLISKENNFIISSTVISSNNSKLIHVHYLNDIISYQNSFRAFLSINSLHLSLSKDKMNALALFSVNNVLAEVCQDNKNTFITLSVESIQLDNQNPYSKTPVCIVGTGKNLLNEKNITNKFIKLYSIFPRGVPFLTVINFLSIQVQPLFIVPDSNLIGNLISFFTSISKNKTTISNNNTTIIEPSFNSVNINKTMIAYFELDPINIIINIPNENNRNDRDSIASAMRYMNMFSLNRFAISVPKIFISEFNNNFSYLIELFRDFYGNEVLKQVAKNVVVKMVTSSLIRFRKLHFYALSFVNNNNFYNEILSDNRKRIYGYFNQIELSAIAKQSKYYFGQSPDVIKEILDEKSGPKSVANILIHHPGSEKSNQKSDKNNIINKDRLILGIKTDSISNSSTNNVDIISVFKSNDIKRVRMHSISPIYSSFEPQAQDNMKFENLANRAKVEEIHMKLHLAMLKDKKMQDQTIKFVIESKQKGIVYCITNEFLLVFVMEKNNFQIVQEYKISKMESITLKDSIVVIKPADTKLESIEIKFDKIENAQTLQSFMNAQKTVIGVFGRPIIP